MATCKRFPVSQRLIASLFLATAVVSPSAAQRSDLGVNITWPADWSQDHVFADVMKTARGWSYPATWTQLPPAELDPQGWPRTDARCFVWANGNMQGTYRLSLTGRAGIDIGGGGAGATVRDVVYDSSTGKTTAAIVIASDGVENFWIDFTGTNGGVRNVKLMRPSFPGSTSSYPDSALVTDAFRQAVEPFSTIRFMQFTSTIYSSQKSWSDRVQPDYASFNRDPADFGGRGASWECVIQIANALHKDAWINVPLWVDDDYIRQLALLFRDGNGFTANRGLDPALHLYVELSNEIWNYEQNENKDSAVAEVLSRGDPYHLNYDNLTLAEASNGWEWGWRRPGAGIVRISNVFREVFGDGQMMSRVRPVLCWQAVRHATAWAPLEYIEMTQPHPVNYYVYAGGGSAYYSPDLESPGVSLETIWSSASMDTAWWRDTWPDGLAKCSMMFNSYLCNLYGIKRVAYEGGPSFDSGGPNDSVMELAWSDPRIASTVVDHQNAWSRWGGDLLVYYVLTQDYRWAFASNVFDLSNPKYQGVTALSAGSPAPVEIGNRPGVALDGNAFRLGRGEWYDSARSGSVWRHNGDWVSYLYNVLFDGDYSATVSLSTYDQLTEVEWWMDGTKVHTTPLSGFRDETREVGPVTFHLSPGLHTLRIGANVEGWVLNSVLLDAVPTSVAGALLNPRTFALEQNYPNPFNPATSIGYSVPGRCNVRLEVFDLLGREVRVLVGGIVEEGRHRVIWDGRDSGGNSVGSGVYICRLTGVGISAARKLLLLR